MDFSKIDLAQNQVLARKIIREAAGEKIKNRREFEKFRNGIVKRERGDIFHNLYLIKAYQDLVDEGVIGEDLELLGLIQKRSVRTQSGVAPVTVMMKPYPCVGRCIYCPNDVRMPKSYLPSQPAAQRAFRQRFDPYSQVFVRLKALGMTGHEISKVELRVIGGTFSNYPRSYQKWFLKQCLLAMNEFSLRVKDVEMSDVTKINKISSVYGVDEVNTVVLKSLKGRRKWGDVVKENEKALVRCIGINVETRPDFIDEGEVKRLRELGVTKVEMGVQTLDDEVQKQTGRGHGVSDVVNATKLLRDSGFKIGYHMMPNLPGSSVSYDKKMVGELFEREEFQPDYLKIYPCVVMPRTKLALMYRDGKYKSYSEKVLEDVLFENMKAVPEWCRVDRIARDIPSDEIESGFRVSNIRQVLEKRGSFREIRYREIRGEEAGEAKLVLRSYRASGGMEYFLSFEDLEKDKIVGFLRLRIGGEPFISELKGCALVRDLHVYGKQVRVGDRGGDGSQHLGWGGKLLNEAEKLAKRCGFGRIAVIAGIGTREYYKKKGYRLKGTYMIKFDISGCCC